MDPVPIYTIYGHCVVLRRASGKDLSSSPYHPLLSAMGLSHIRLVLLMKGPDTASQCLCVHVCAVGRVPACWSWATGIVTFCATGKRDFSLMKFET